MNVIKEIQRVNAREAQFSTAGSDSGSWHEQYRDSAYIFVGGMPYELTEGDIICVLSQFGEIIGINLVRDKDTGKSKGFAFLKYMDQRSTVLAVDNMNGAKIGGRTIRVDHVQNYKVPKVYDEDGNELEPDEDTVNNAAPKPAQDDSDEEDDGSSESEVDDTGIDIDDPMREFLLKKRRKEARKAKRKAEKKEKKEKKESPESKEERRLRKEQKRAAKKTEKEGRSKKEDNENADNINNNDTTPSTQVDEKDAKEAEQISKTIKEGISQETASENADSIRKDGSSKPTHSGNQPQSQRQGIDLARGTDIDRVVTRVLGETAIVEEMTLPTTATATATTLLEVDRIATKTLVVIGTLLKETGNVGAVAHRTLHSPPLDEETITNVIMVIQGQDTGVPALGIEGEGAGVQTKVGVGVPGPRVVIEIAGQDPELLCRI
ncbi:hypothetical protein BGW38_002050 [Lunasporangiospora selenospora]|uniref:RRM domain-containing protein n=1 Tax=Lunasporangiospora selenospora TaxID=979761 RepID=A0A9P6KDN1_9FUNG|nr:hypothetical protein BGW38_002050 [Lunasporangiospora selenospora]